MACTSSSVSTVAERSSSSNIASSPKMSPGPKCASAIDAPVGMLADRAGVAGAHDVARVAGVALAEDHVMAGERARHRDLDHALQVVRCQRLEDRHLPQQSYALLCSGHAGRLNGLGAVGLPRSAARRRTGGARRAPRAGVAQPKRAPSAPARSAR